MEKNIKKRVCRLAAVLSAGLVVLFGYWFFLNPHGYWQKKKEAEKNEYMDRRMLWRKSEKMTMQQMLSDMTLMAKGDSVLVCWQGMLGLRQDIGICLLSLKAEDGWRNVSRRGFTRAWSLWKRVDFRCRRIPWRIIVKRNLLQRRLGTTRCI